MDWDFYAWLVRVYFSESKPLGSSSRSRPRSEARSLSDVDMFSTVSRLDEEEEDAEFFDLSDDEMIVQVNRYDSMGNEITFSDWMCGSLLECLFAALLSKLAVTVDTFCSETDAIMENEPLEELLKQVDTLFTGSSEDKSLAYQILHERRNKVKWVL